MHEVLFSLAKKISLFKVLKLKEPDSVRDRKEHVSILKQLQLILNKKIHRHSPEPRVREVPSTSVDPTHPEVLRTTKRIHQKRTRANHPYSDFIEEQKQKREQQKAKQQTTKAKTTP